MHATPDVIFRYPDPDRVTHVGTIIERRAADRTISRWRVVRVAFHGEMATAEVEEER